MASAVDLALGFKVAVVDLSAGTVAVRLGMPIGRTTAAVGRGRLSTPTTSRACTSARMREVSNDPDPGRPSEVQKAEAYYNVLGRGSFAAGNAEGGLTAIEEKSLGA